ncbi:MAG: helix-turn-helix domain-containing protein [Euryarchaeota archaeon]|nr:helix-turn-helix domain-containing protein [Euryarchaeota archaeon]
MVGLLLFALLVAPGAQAGVSEQPVPWMSPSQEDEPKEDEGVQDGWQDRPSPTSPSPSRVPAPHMDGSGEEEGPPLPSDVSPTQRVPAPAMMGDDGDAGPDTIPVPPGRVEPRDLFELPDIPPVGEEPVQPEEACRCDTQVPQDDGVVVMDTDAGDDWLLPAAGITLATLVGALLVRLALLLVIAAKVRLGYRIERSELLEHPVRRTIADHLEKNPGATAGELANVAGVAYARVCYHLAMMVREQALRVQRVDHRKRYFPYGAPKPDEAELRTRTLTSPERMPGRILTFVRRAPGLTGSRLSRALGISPGHAHYHLSRLLDHGLLEARRKGREVRYYLTTRGAEKVGDAWATA